MIKDFTDRVENEVKELKREFLSMLVATLGLSLLGNMLAEKGVIRVGEEQLEQMKEQIEQGRIFNAASSFNQF